MLKTHLLRQKRHTSIRSKVSGTAERPRLSVYRGLRHLYVQLIDDTTGTTLAGLSSKNLSTKGTGTERAKALGAALAEKAKEKNITTLVFDRGGFRYHGQVKALADSLRDAGITF